MDLYQAKVAACVFISLRHFWWFEHIQCISSC